jgi:hypothetical protein
VARYQPVQKEGEMTQQAAIDLLQRVSNTGVTITKFESLLRIDGVKGYSLSQGQ